MAKSQETFSKKEKEKKRRKKKQDKMERREQRKMEKAEKGKLSFEDQIMYVDEFGNFTDTPPDPTKRLKIKAEDIRLGVPPRDNTPMDPIRTGIVKFFNNEKGYGFINDLETKESVFVHINNVNEPIGEGNRVKFEVEMGQKGANAVNVSIAPVEPPKPKKPKVDPAAEVKEEVKTEAKAEADSPTEADKK